MKKSIRPVNLIYCNNTQADLTLFHAEIAASLRATGTLPEDLQDMFTVSVAPALNPDGSKRYLINAA